MTGEAACLAFAPEDRARCIKLYGIDPEQSLIAWLSSMVDDPAEILERADREGEILREVFHPRRPLTPRERQVLRLYSRGLSSKEIGDALSLAQYTIKSYRRDAVLALEAGHLAYAVVLFVLLEDDDAPVAIRRRRNPRPTNVKGSRRRALRKP